jgi:hypothetical protein
MDDARAIADERARLEAFGKTEESEGAHRAHLVRGAPSSSLRGRSFGLKDGEWESGACRFDRGAGSPRA